ncbi:hypothetical protein J6590_044740 [Homalodisca vitripennis]|nr:hypothetical protein J6590_044740 [Homalodisca vitripennis]
MFHVDAPHPFLLRPLGGGSQKKGRRRLRAQNPLWRFLSKLLSRPGTNGFDKCFSKILPERRIPPNKKLVAVSRTDSRRNERFTASAGSICRGEGGGKGRALRRLTGTSRVHVDYLSLCRTHWTAYPRSHSAPHHINKENCGARRHAIVVQRPPAVARHQSGKFGRLSHEDQPAMASSTTRAFLKKDFQLQEQSGPRTLSYCNYRPLKQVHFYELLFFRITYPLGTHSCMNLLGVLSSYSTPGRIRLVGNSESWISLPIKHLDSASFWTY